jgi:hypothetical protein
MRLELAARRPGRMGRVVHDRERASPGGHVQWQALRAVDRRLRARRAHGRVMRRERERAARRKGAPVLAHVEDQGDPCQIPTCAEGSSAACVPAKRRLPEDTNTCVMRHGEHACPPEWEGSRFVVYEFTANVTGYIEGCDCTPCACGEAFGGFCLARLRTFQDGACSKLITDDAIASLGGAHCENVYPPGLAIGSVEITPPEYIAGACEPSGGEPIGSVNPDPAHAVTACCRGAAA